MDQAPVLNVVGEKVAVGPPRRGPIPTSTRRTNGLGPLPTFGAPPLPRTEEHETKRFETPVAGDDLVVTVHDRAGTRPVGTRLPRDVDGRDRPATLGMPIIPLARGQGVGTEATEPSLDAAIAVLGRHSV